MMHMTPKEYQKKSPHLQTFWETGYDVEMLKNVY